MAIPAGFGIDFANCTVTLFDDGRDHKSTSTWPQPEGSNKEARLESIKNKVAFFTVSQKDMLESTLRVAGIKEDGWTITKEPAQERYSSGINEMQEGECIGFAKVMYARVFHRDNCGDFEHNKSALNSLLKLPREEIDKATKAATERSKASKWFD